jgi:hypothetical protein
MSSFRAARDAHNAASDPVADALATAREILPSGYDIAVRPIVAHGPPCRSMVRVDAPDGSAVNIAGPEHSAPRYALSATPANIVDAAVRAAEHGRRALRDHFAARIRPYVDASEVAWLASLDEPFPLADDMDAWHFLDWTATQSGPGVACHAIRQRALRTRGAFWRVFATLALAGLINDYGEFVP